MYVENANRATKEVNKKMEKKQKATKAANICYGFGDLDQ